MDTIIIGHDVKVQRHNDPAIKNICENYRELLHEIDKEIRANARKEEEKNK